MNTYERLEALRKKLDTMKTDPISIIAVIDQLIAILLIEAGGGQ